MSGEASRTWRLARLGAAIVSVAVAYAPPSRAQDEAWGGLTVAARAPGFHLTTGDDFGGLFEGTTRESPDGQQAPPPQKPTPPSMQDLGFAPDQDRGDAEAQARLDKRTHMLKVHQTLGLITLAPMVATVLATGNVGSKGTESARNLHGALGLVTVGLYITTASFAIRAPSIPGMETRGPIKVHKALAWVHGVGMILTPILGAMARSQLNSGEKVHGIATAHGAVAWATIGTYAVAIGTVAIKF